MRISSVIKTTTFLIAGTLLYCTPAYSWYIEYNVSGNLYSEDNGNANGDNITSFQVSDDLDYEVSASWEIASTETNPDGSIDVYYNVEEGSSETQGLSADISFTILSDYGNMDSVAINSILNGYVDTESFIDDQDPNTTIDKYSSAMAEISHDADLSTAGVPDLDAESIENENNNDFFDDLPVTLYTNTEYSLFSDINFDISAMLAMYLPDSFENQKEYDIFIDEYGTEASVSAYGRAGMFWEISIDGTETPVPEPSTMLLLGLSIIGLAGSKVIKKK